MIFNDQIGISWRPELALGIFAHLDEIDIVEIMADDFFDVPAHQARAIRTLGGQVPICLHGISQGLASTIQPSMKRLDQMARLIELTRPAFWSEHLAFVRGGGIEIGHLAAPPRTLASVEGAAANIERAFRHTGLQPHMENIATLIDPPGSTLSEQAWIVNILNASSCNLLLDLHNLYSNALNFGYDPVAFIDALPLSRIGSIHLSGGRWVSGPSPSLNEGRWLDDHLHDVPDPVFDLLRHLAAKTDRPLKVILERDGRYPPFEQLLMQIRRARAAVQEGRNRISTLMAATA